MPIAAFGPGARFHAHWQRGVETVLDALFPPRCGGCGELNAQVFCERCTAQLRPIRHPRCALCGKPFDPLAFSAPLCADCRGHRWPIEAARAAFVFEGPMREAIHRFKYGRHHTYARRLAPLLERKWTLDATLCDFRPDWIVAVPLHASRQRERGFNQSQLLAHELAQHRAVPLFEGFQRIRKTQSQVGLDLPTRRRNVKDAFEVALPVGAQLRGKHLLLVDDVYTTGATTNECARVLKKAGAAEVRVLTLARQGGPQDPDVAPFDWRTLDVW